MMNISGIQKKPHTERKQNLHGKHSGTERAFPHPRAIISEVLQEGQNTACAI